MKYEIFTDEEEEFETKEIEIEDEKEEPAKLPTFMRNKIEKEEKEKETFFVPEEKKEEPVISDREVVKTRGSNFSFPIDMEEDYDVVYTPRTNKNVLDVIEEEKPKTTVAELYAKKEEPKPKKFKPTPVISPIYGVLDKNYTKDEVKLQDESTYEIPRQSKKVDFETVRNKAYGTLTDDIRNNLCKDCELYKEVIITKKNGRKVVDDDVNLLEDMTEEPKKDISIEEAAENYYDFGVDYEPIRKTPTVINAEKVDIEVNNDIKIVNHNDEEASAEKIEVKEETIELPKEIEEKKETPKRSRKKVKEEEKELEDTKEFEKVEPEESAESILESIESTDLNDDDIPLDTDANDIFNLIDSMYDEEEK